ncbi:MAG: hypothetical protein A2Z34_00400 [Planctomycetes bacterium RBG_16_59_8]|nr:MAG: hypothetical protein A2Z34_00400 [Planctomycetes bacterium RBG_16_59_8]
MTKKGRVTRKFKMAFPAKVLGDPIMYTLAHDLNVVPNICRGRITDKTAWLEVEIEGKEKNIDMALKYLAEKGVGSEEIVSK